MVRVIQESTDNNQRRWLTLREVASLLGCSESTVRRRCQTGQLAATRASSPFGEHWLIDAEELRAPEPPPTPTKGFHHATVSRTHQPSRLYEDQLSIKTEGLHLESEAAPSVPPVDSTVPLAAHLELLKLLERSHDSARLTERQLIALEYELQNYRRALTENAESLAEREALTKTQIAQEVSSRESLQSELNELKTQLVQAEQKASRWNRLPRWIRRLLDSSEAS